MAEQHVRVYLAPGDEAQLADLEPDDFIEFAGSINGSPVPVRFYRLDDERNETEVTVLSVTGVLGKITVMHDADASNEQIAASARNALDGFVVNGVKISNDDLDEWEA